MRAALSAVAALSLVVSAWLLVMYLVLRHPGYQWRAAMALGLIGIGMVAIAGAWLDAAPPVLRAALVVGAAILAFVGVTAIVGNHRPGGHFEGYLEVAGLLFSAQAVLMLLRLRRAT